MGLREDRKRFKSIGEENRQDLEDFVQYADLGESREDLVKIPIKIVSLPEFVYNDTDRGGVGQAPDDADPEEGDPVDVEPQPGDEDGDAGGDGGEHGYYEMDPEEFAQELDEELGLDLEPKGKEVIEEELGDFTDVARRGPDSTLELDVLFKKGLKRKLALEFDEEYARSVLQVSGIGVDRAFEYLREQNVPVSRSWLSQEYDSISDITKWETIDEMESSVQRTGPADSIRAGNITDIPFRKEDEQYRHPEVVEKEQKNVVVVNIRDVSGSMNGQKRELVERVMTPMDWYLQGKYDNAEFVYIAHDAEAWEVARDEFFGIKSGGGTIISTAYRLAQEILNESYPWETWNRYVFAAGDGENRGDDTVDNVIPLMEEIDANEHAYIQVQPGSQRRKWMGTHADELESYFMQSENVTVEHIAEKTDVTDAIVGILGAENNDE